MVIEKAIENHLKAHAGLSALVGNRVFSEIVPDSNTTYPAVSFALVSGIDDHCLGTDSDSTEERWQFNIYASSAGSRSDVSKQLRAAFKDFTGVMGGVGGLTVQAVLQENRIDTYYSEIKLYLRTVDFMFIRDDS